ncbi:MAG TPA: F0F1 ATP synthase subunit B [Candidatus Saccharimonadales bacterium]|nr:F0F1 ATP synthase subunit B [Candidatus Saccharimonadales bacterium]
MLEIISRFAAEEAEPTGFAALGIDGQAFIVQLLTFLLVFFVLYRFVFHRIVDILEKRQKTIEEGVNLTSEMQAEKEKLDAEVDRVRKQTRAESDELIVETKDKASLIIKQAEEKSQAKAEQIIQEAKQKILEESDRAKRKLEKEMVELIVSATEEVTRQKLDDSKDRQLVSKILKERV